MRQIYQAGKQPYNEHYIFLELEEGKDVQQKIFLVRKYLIFDFTDIPARVQHI